MKSDCLTEKKSSSYKHNKVKMRHTKKNPIEKNTFTACLGKII